MRHSEKPLDADGSKSSLVTESSELLTEETTLKDDGGKASPKSASRELAAVQNVAPAASTRNSGKRLSRRFKSMALQEYHGQAWPSSVMDRSSKPRRQQEQPRQDYQSKHGGRAQASAALVERDTEQRVQERMASKDAEEWKTGRSRGALSASCTTLVPRGASTPTEVPERQHSSATVSEANTEYNAGDNPDSLGMQDRRKPNILLFDSLVNHDQSARSNTPVPWKFRDIGTSPFLPHSRGYMEFSRRPTVSYPESLMDLASSPRSTELDASIIVCVIVVVLLVTLFAIALFAWNKLWYDDYSAVTDSVNEGACFNAACEMVVTLLGKSQDPSVPPCKDFYRHTCGRWYAKSSRRASYAIENRHDFHARVHHNLERLASATAFSNSSTYQMALFYSSCHRFKNEQRITPVEDVLNVSRLDVHQWLAATSFPELLATIVTECLRTGLVSVISVKRGEGQRIYVDKGEALVSILTGYSKRVPYFVKDALAALGLNRNYTLATEIVALDSTIQWFNSTVPSEYHSVVVHDLPPQGLVLAWVLGLNRGLHNRTKVDGPTPLFARRLPEIRNVMWTLSSVDLNLASVYSLLLPLAQIMSYAVPFGAQEVVRASDESDVCLRETAERFRMNFPTWVTQTIETPEIHGYVSVMVNALESVATEHPDIQEDLVLNATDFAEMQINTTYIYARGMPRAVPQMDSENFLGNIVTLIAEDVIDSDETWYHLASQQLNGHLSYDGKVLLVPTMFIVTDMLHAQASDPVLDYSTVGVRVLATWASILVERSPTLSSKLAKMKRCAKARMNATEKWPGGKGFPEGTLRWMLLLPWALDVALIAARRRHPGHTNKVVDAMSRDQLFFRRFCQTTCGDARGAALCDYGTRHSVLFANAFGCQEALPLAC